MRIQAQVQNQAGQHVASVQTNGVEQTLAIAPKAGGLGSSVNGGELLFLALATCYCNDVYREAARQNLTVDSVEVRVEGDFEGIGAPATNVVYHVRVQAPGDPAVVRRLLEHTDTVAEIQNTLRTLTPVTLGEIEITTA